MDHFSPGGQVSLFEKVMFELKSDDKEAQRE